MSEQYHYSVIVALRVLSSLKLNVGAMWHRNPQKNQRLGLILRSTHMSILMACLRMPLLKRYVLKQCNSVVGLGIPVRCLFWIKDAIWIHIHGWSEDAIREEDCVVEAFITLSKVFEYICGVNATVQKEAKLQVSWQWLMFERSGAGRNLCLLVSDELYEHAVVIFWSLVGLLSFNWIGRWWKSFPSVASLRRWKLMPTL